MQNGPNANAIYNLPPNSPVLVQREGNTSQSGYQDGLFTLLTVKGKICTVKLSSGPIAFLITVARYITIGDSISDLTIQGQALKTRSIGTSPLGLAKLLIALNAIQSSISLLILGILVIIIQQARRNRLQQRSTILIELYALTSTPFILIPIIVVYYLNSLLTKFFLVLWVIRSSSPRQVLIQYIRRTSYIYLALISYSYLPA